MIEISSRKLMYCHKCDLNSIVSRRSTRHGIPIFEYWCKGGCGTSFIKPVNMTDIIELQERQEAYRKDKQRQIKLPIE